MKYNFLKSRTFYTICLMFVIGGFEAIQGVIPTSVYVVINGALGVLATYFHVNKKTQT